MYIINLCSSTKTVYCCLLCFCTWFYQLRTAGNTCIIFFLIFTVYSYFILSLGFYLWKKFKNKSWQKNITTVPFNLIYIYLCRLIEAYVCLWCEQPWMCLLWNMIMVMNCMRILNAFIYWAMKFRFI